MMDYMIALTLWIGIAAIKNEKIPPLTQEIAKYRGCAVTV